MIIVIGYGYWGVQGNNYQEAVGCKLSWLFEANIYLGEKHTLMRFKAVEIGIHLKGKTVIVDKYPTVWNFAE